jgi:hypothetical protein
MPVIPSIFPFWRIALTAVIAAGVGFASSAGVSRV